MWGKTLIRTGLAAILAALATAGSERTRAADARPESALPVAAVETGTEFVSLGMGKSLVIDLPRDVKDVLVADPRIANAVIRSARRAYVIGVAVGQTNIFFFDEAGRQLAGLDIAVTRDLNGLRAAFRRMFPDGDVRIEGVGPDGVMLAGTVATPLEAQQAYDIASRLSGDGTKVVNGITVKGRDQVMIKVTVAEVQRDVIKQLGIDLSGALAQGNSELNFAVINPFTAFGQTLSGTKVAATVAGVTSYIRAMERAGVIRTLAEPSLSAISGESATFLAGGEFPIPGGVTCDNTGRNCQVAVQFKKFGIGLNFTPVVLGEGRISLKVMTEVSDLSNESSMSIQPIVGGPTVTIPSIRVRRAETTVELPSGGALALAGMIQEQTKQQINGFPGLLEVPILGTLFRSRDYVNRQTELMILVTPYTVRAVAQKALSRPDDGFADATDPAAVLLGRLNRLYGVAGAAAPTSALFGKYGFILD